MLYDFREERILAYVEADNVFMKISPRSTSLKDMRYVSCDDDACAFRWESLMFKGIVFHKERKT